MSSAAWAPSVRGSGRGSTLEPGEPGDYVLVCFIPGRDGIPHVMKGMVTPVTIG